MTWETTSKVFIPPRPTATATTTAGTRLMRRVRTRRKKGYKTSRLRVSVNRASEELTHWDLPLNETFRYNLAKACLAPCLGHKGRNSPSQCGSNAGQLAGTYQGQCKYKGRTWEVSASPRFDACNSPFPTFALIKACASKSPVSFPGVSGCIEMEENAVAATIRILEAYFSKTSNKAPPRTLN